MQSSINCKQYSNKTKLLQVMAWVNRFFAKVRRHQVSASINITPQEFKASEKLWVKAIQARNFEEDRKYLLGILNMATLLVRLLVISLDDEDMIGCQGRIEHSSLPKAAKQPILLSTRHHYIELVVNNCHHTVHHNGVKEIHELYWIPHGSCQLYWIPHGSCGRLLSMH